MSELTLIVPAKNESESLPHVLDELKIHDVKIKVVLHEKDILTINSIRDYDCEVVFQKNEGFGDALIQGISETHTKYFCIFNSDGSFIGFGLNTAWSPKVDDSNKVILGGKNIKIHLESSQLYLSFRISEKVHTLAYNRI